MLTAESQEAYPKREAYGGKSKSTSANRDAEEDEYGTADEADTTSGVEEDAAALADEASASIPESTLSAPPLNRGISEDAQPVLPPETDVSEAAETGSSSAPSLVTPPPSLIRARPLSTTPPAPCKPASMSVTMKPKNNPTLILVEDSPIKVKREIEEETPAPPPSRCSALANPVRPSPAMFDKDAALKELALLEAELFRPWFFERTPSGAN